MAETDYQAFSAKTPGDRSTMHVLYALHTVAPFTYLTLAAIAMVVNYVKRSDEQDALYLAHHNYMISTFWWSVLWLVVTSPLYLLFIFPGVAAAILVGAWYIYRCVRGWLRFNDNRLPQ
jgi:uncharacterized membrane protein